MKRYLSKDNNIGEPKKRFRFLRWLLNVISKLLDITIAFLEIHLLKIVSFTIMALCCSMVNALHMMIVFTLQVSVIFGPLTMRYSLSIIGPFLGLLFLCTMTYQTNLYPKIPDSPNCTVMNDTFEIIVQKTILDFEWWGLQIIPEGETLVSFYKSYIIVFLVMTLVSVIWIRQKIARLDAGEPGETPAVMFPKTTRKQADHSLSECLKFLINYGFYKFGVEITLSFCVFVIAFRTDVFSVLYSIWIVLLFMAKRKTLQVLWPFFFITLFFSILWQYSMAVGLSKKPCFDYPWNDRIPLVIWMFLPSFQNPPNTIKTLVDFVLILLIQRQQNVFDTEKKLGDKYKGGSNREEYKSFHLPDLVNPIPDHTGSIKSWLEVFKFLFMSCSFRITLAFEFWNGASNNNLLSLGYLVGAFVFLWIDYNLCLWRIKKIMKWWNTLLGYTVFVIMMKSMLEFYGCVYGDYLLKNMSWLIELLNLSCKSGLPEQPLTHKDSSSIYWDVVCFTLAIFQRRYFQSFYFLHEKEDVLGVFRLQDKGARLMDELQKRKLKQFQLKQRRTLMKIKKNMNRIKAWQKKMQGPNLNEPTDHKTAIYMGDYLMFEDLVEISETRLDDSSSSDSDEDIYLEDGTKKKEELMENFTMSKFLGTVLKGANEESSTKVLQKKESQEMARGSGAKKRVRTEEASDVTKSTEEKTLSRADFSTLTLRSEEKEKFRNSWRLFRIFLDSIMVSMINFFSKYSKDYQYIESIMKDERKQQKRRHKPESTEDSALRFPGLHKTDSEIKKRLSVKSEDSREDELEGSTKKSSQGLLVILINYICVFVMSKTELFCYLVIFLHTLFSPTLISIPLPLLVFLWGSLTSIRPTTTFWTVLITYTEVTVVIKALFQNSIFPWNSWDKSSIRPEYPPLFLGIHRDNKFVIADLILLLLLFLHRYKLKSLGLWNRTHEAETILPKDLKVYRELPSGKSYEDDEEGKRQEQKRVTSDLVANDSLSSQVRMATWKRTSRATGKLYYWYPSWGNKIRTKIIVREIEGRILVTHDGRRMEPTHLYASQMTEDLLEGNMVLRVYNTDASIESKNLFYKMSWIQHFTSLRKFFVQILIRDWRVAADFYTLMFVFEFLNFIVVFFGYTWFTEPTEVALEGFNLAANQVPILYLFTIICHFLVIVIDRILYLRKSVLGKLILQFILIIMVHSWMFIVLPIATESPFNKLIVPQFYYIISCLYFLMSAYQLRVGYPMRVQGHFLCKKYGYFNYYFYKLGSLAIAILTFIALSYFISSWTTLPEYMKLFTCSTDSLTQLQFIPFFNQLRTVLDYICIHSSMTMVEWLKMESIFRLVYENKCCRRADIQYPMPRGEECPKCTKYPPGIFVLYGIIVVIWLPFIIFALFGTVAQPNLPQEGTLVLQIENFGNIYTNEASFADISSITEAQFKTFHTLFKDNKKAWSFLSSYDHTDVAVLRFKFEPYKPWIITPQQSDALKKYITNTALPISLYFTWHVRRMPQSQIVATAKGYLKIVLDEKTPARTQLADAILEKGTKVYLKHLLPKFIDVNNEGEANPVSGFLSGDNQTNPFRNVGLSMESQTGLKWWILEELADDPQEGTRISKIPYQHPGEIVIYTFNEKIIPKLLLNISRRGIIGLYLSLVLFFWSIIKRAMWKYPLIMFEDMPNPDPVLKLCQDIYLARESHEFALEEDLFAKLLFLFRSPETMVKVTKLNPV